MSHKTKAIKIPIQLEELVRENEKEDRPIGEVLLEAYKDYLKIKELAGILSKVEGIKEGSSVSSIFASHIENDLKRHTELETYVLELRNRFVEQ
ncbi:MAG: hypothetical protein O8C61_11440 [Candidatus Methanoperedens sp.]|nr:hypothetical protein [Candidatus Methanoperedens sp.]